METNELYVTRAGIQALAVRLENEGVNILNDLGKLAKGLAEHAKPKPYPEEKPPKTDRYLAVADFASRYWQVLQYRVYEGFGACDHLIIYWAYLPSLPEPHTEDGVRTVPQGTEEKAPRQCWECKGWTQCKAGFCSTRVLARAPWEPVCEAFDETEEAAVHPFSRAYKFLDADKLQRYCNNHHFDILDRWECLELEGVSFWDWLEDEHPEVLEEFQAWFSRRISLEEET